MVRLFSAVYLVLAVSVLDASCKSLDSSWQPQHNSTLQSGASDCSLNPDSIYDWPEWPPIMTDELGGFLLPTGTEGSRQISIGHSTEIILSCPGTELYVGGEEVWARCEGGTGFTTRQEGVWRKGVTEFVDLGCRHQPYDETQVAGTCGPHQIGTLIKIGFNVDSDMRGTIEVCHDLQISRTLWAKHKLWDEVRASDHGNDRPSWDQDYFNFDVDHYYKQITQKETIGQLVGSEDLADEYLPGGDVFLARGHLAPNGDFIFYSWMDSSFYFVNVAPQWQCFNGKNWNYFEQGLREFIVDHTEDVVIYTGTHEVMQLQDVNGDMVQIFLYDGDKLPVPRFYWKIIHDPEAGKGVAIIGINNPHLKSVPPEMILCPKIPNHPLLDRLHEHVEDISRGYMYACRVEDLAKVVEEIPELPSMDLLT